MSSNLRKEIAEREADANLSSDSDDEDFVPDDGRRGDGEEEVDSGDDDDRADRSTQSTAGDARTTRARAAERPKDDRQSKSIVDKIPDNIDALWDDFLADEPKKTTTSVKSSMIKTSSKPVKPSISTVSAPKPKPPIVNPFDDVIDPFAEDIRPSAGSSTSKPTPPTTSKSAPPVKSSYTSFGEPPPKKSILSASLESWNTFKTDNGIDPELASANRGRDGYIERVEFLGRADYRQFEHERTARAHSRTHKPADS